MNIAGSMLPLLMLIIPAALALAAIFGIPALIDRSRRKAYAKFCSVRGYAYQPSRHGAEAAYAGTVSMFKVGGGRKWRHEISGQLDGKPFTAFEYRYAEGAGRFRTAYTEAMMHWRLSGLSLPNFTLVPANNFLFRIGKSPEDVDFPEDSSFSKAYVLTGQDGAAIRSLFTPSLRGAIAAAPGQYVAGGGQDLFWWQQGRLPSPDRFDQFLNMGGWIAGVFAGA
jgi:hypothetical protein